MDASSRGEAATEYERRYLVLGSSYLGVRVVYGEKRVGSSALGSVRWGCRARRRTSAPSYLRLSNDLVHSPLHVLLGTQGPSRVGCIPLISAVCLPLVRPVLASLLSKPEP